MADLRDNVGVSAFVGRTEPLARLSAAYRAVAGRAGGPAGAWAGLALVTGEAGIGKTALLTRFAAGLAADGATVVWGTCWDGDQAPAWWPWTQTLRALLESRPGLRRELAQGAWPELAAIVPELAAQAFRPGTDADARLRVFDTVGRLVRRTVAECPVAILLDDLHWADQSSVDLLRFLARLPQPGPLLLVGAYRPYEPAQGIAAMLADLAATGELVPLRGLSVAEVADLVQVVGGPDIAGDWAGLVHERSGGHPFYARELCQLLATTGAATEVPAAVREVIRHRLSRLSHDCAALLAAAAVAGPALMPDVLAEVTAADTTRVATLVDVAETAGVLVRAGGSASAVRFAHDLYRETIAGMLTPTQRLDLHHRIANALLHRHVRGAPVFPAELAHHYTAALVSAGVEAAVTWAHAAARADAARFAFVEAASHLTRLRSAVEAAGRQLSDADLVGLLTTEAELLLRSGDAVRPRALLTSAWSAAIAAGSPDLVGTVALGLDRLDARFAMPRADLVAALDTARRALEGTGGTLEATVTAALARQLQHSVPADRPRASPLAQRAVGIARALADPATLASCLLAQHDTLWTPGTATARATIAAEIGVLAKRADDHERYAQSLLLLATAHLENASPAFRAALAEYGYLTKRLRQPRHDYLVLTRQAALALLDGDIELGERLSAQAAELGEAVGEVDTGNVRMSQRLEVVRARNRPTELRALAAEAVRWWIGAPAHAHAVAAGFLARAGDIDEARRELDTVLALDQWHADRSYLWSVFIGELVTAAIAVGDHPLCRRLLGELLPVADTCAVNAALVCFMGAHAHRVGLLHACLGDQAAAQDRLHQALEIHTRLGARAWQAESHRALARLGGPDAAGHTRQAATLDARSDPAAPIDVPGGFAAVPGGGPVAASAVACMVRTGDMWRVSYRGRTAYVRDTKGMHDLAALLNSPGTDLPALTLAGGPAAYQAHASAAEPILDRVALHAYRRRLDELDEDVAQAREHNDLARQRRADDERERLLTELRRATRPDGRSRTMANAAAERARKAVTARIRDAMRRISDAHPELGEHLDRAVRTGTSCRYDAPPG